jgi:hypothetical protein
MVKDILMEYGIPIAVSLSLGLGGMAISNSTKIAVLESETHNMVEVQKEMIHELKELNRVIYKIDAKLEVQNE